MYKILLLKIYPQLKKESEVWRSIVLSTLPNSYLTENYNKIRYSCPMKNATPKITLPNCESIPECTLSGRDPFDQNFRKFRYKIKWNRTFLEICFKNCGQPPGVVLKFWKNGMHGKSRSIRRFLLGPSFSEAGNQHGRQSWSKVSVRVVPAFCR